MFVTRSSTWVKSLYVDLIFGTAEMETEDGYIYSYTNVSRRAILNLATQKNMSLGFWCNKNLVNSSRVTHTVDYSFT